MENKEKIDPALIAAFEASMLEFEQAYAKAQANAPYGLKRCTMDRLKELRQWTAQYLIDEFALICAKKSKMSSKDRDFVSAVGIRARAIWEDVQRKVIEAAEPPKELPQLNSRFN